MFMLILLTISSFPVTHLGGNLQSHDAHDITAGTGFYFRTSSHVGNSLCCVTNKEPQRKSTGMDYGRAMEEQRKSHCEDSGFYSIIICISKTYIQILNHSGQIVTRVYAK